MNHKVEDIAKTLNLPLDKVALVLYCYLGDVLQDLLINRETDTIFGHLKLDSDNNIEFAKNKFEFDNNLFCHTDIKTIIRILENGPDTKLFPM